MRERERVRERERERERGGGKERGWDTVDRCLVDARRTTGEYLI